MSFVGTRDVLTQKISILSIWSNHNQLINLCMQYLQMSVDNENYWYHMTCTMTHKYCEPIPKLHKLNNQQCSCHSCNLSHKQDNND